MNNYIQTLVLNSFDKSKACLFKPGRRDIFWQPSFNRNHWPDLSHTRHDHVIPFWYISDISK